MNLEHHRRAMALFPSDILFQVATLCFILIRVSQPYTIRCPTAGHWNLRAKGLCNVKENYYCLYNPVSELFAEGCTGPQWDRPGSKLVFPDNFNRKSCSDDRFQPTRFWTNGSSQCIIEKSKCSEEGQVYCFNGSTKTDRECRCDYSRGYGYVTSPVNMCTCVPTKEECSCYKQTCSDPGMVLSSEYKCTTRTSIVGACQPITTCMRKINNILTNAFVNTSYQEEPGQEQKNVDNKVIPGSQYRKCAAYAVLVIWLMIVLSGKCFLCRCLVSYIIYTICDTYLNRKYSDAGHHIVISKEEQNYLRIIYLLFRVAGYVVRIAFSKEINPKQLHKTIKINKNTITEKLINTNRIDKSQWIYLNPKPGSTSNDYDIRFMVVLLEALFPAVDKSYDNTLSVVKNYRNELTQTTTGTLSADDFESKWDIISRAILRIAGVNLQAFAKTEDKELIRTKEAVLSLHPVEIRNKNFYLLIKQADNYSSKVLKQIIKQYCRSKHVTLEDFIRSQKHNLFHKRIETASCCDVKCKQKQKPFVKVLSDIDWQKMFTKCKEKNSHVEHAFSSCCESFRLLDEIKWDAALACCLIVYSSELSEYILKVFCKHNKFNAFLNMHKTELCQTSHSAKTYTSTVIEKEELKTLFIKTKQFSCRFECSHRKSIETDRCFCCCRYRAKSKVTVDSIDENLRSKIACSVGPVSVVYSTSDKLFMNFINGEVDENFIQTSLQTLTQAHIDLINIIEDEHVRRSLNKELEEFLGIQSVSDDEVITTIHDWIFKKRTASEDKDLVQIMIKDKKRNDPKQLYTWQSWKNLKLHGTRRMPSITKEENNYLRIVHLMNAVACPAVRKKFMQDIWEKKNNQEMFYEIISHATRSSREHGQAYLTKNNLKVICSQPRDKPPENFDLELLINLLQLSAEIVIDKPINGQRLILKTSNEDESSSNNVQTEDTENKLLERKLDPDVLEIDHFRRKLVHSSTGILNDIDFEYYWQKISQV